MIDFATVDLSLWIPVLFIAVLLYAVASVLHLPEEYFKSRQLREAMMKRRAEKADIERMEMLRAIQDFKIDNMENL